VFHGDSGAARDLSGHIPHRFWGKWKESGLWGMTHLILKSAAFLKKIFISTREHKQREGQRERDKQTPR